MSFPESLRACKNLQIENEMFVLTLFDSLKPVCKLDKFDFLFNYHL